MALPERTAERYAPLIDLSIRSDTGEGRIVDAYAAVFNTPQEVRDQDGHYNEEIAPTAFDRTLEQRRSQVQALFNHGKTIYGTPSERFSMPYGKPLAMRAEPKGLFTSTQISKTELGDEVLQLVKDDVIQGQSFSGAFVPSGNERSKPVAGGLPTIRRNEIVLREYGLTPFPVYTDAQVVGVRAELAAFSPAERLELFRAAMDSEDVDAMALVQQMKPLAAQLASLEADAWAAGDDTMDELMSVMSLLCSLDCLEEMTSGEAMRAFTEALADPRTGNPAPPDPRHGTPTHAQRQQALRAITLEKLNGTH